MEKQLETLKAKYKISRDFMLKVAGNTAKK